MTEQELKELERLAKAAIKQNPGESQDMLEQALVERKDEMWDAIRKKARRRVRMRKARPWIAAAAMVMMAVIISGVIGVNQARAGKEGLLVDIVEGVAGDINIAFSEGPKDFEPAMIDNGTWDEIIAAIEDEKLMALLPKDMPDRYEFFSGTYDKISFNMQDLWLTYQDMTGDSTVIIQYNCLMAERGDIITEIDTRSANDKNVDIEIWDGITIYFIKNDDQNNLIWEQDNFIISIMGESNKEQMREVFDSIIK